MRVAVSAGTWPTLRWMCWAGRPQA